MEDKLYKIVSECLNGNCAEMYDLNPLTASGITSNVVQSLLANGVIVLPCKVGDMVWKAIRGRIWTQKITHITIFEQLVVFVDDDNDGCFVTENIGKTVFLTREEAEAKLEEK